ncbi:hypothetical protein [Shewanella nanhaiensis]|uniref:Uncharacterized protein n=1 Tax=Shewanella nanhaiensis TaxID=2864872 RepID=A0ABS7E044_9GAMM|nr:hypothetical protein [Shewanella nanhaiensis]MBW8183014.1 hypothetical protein [Shewanella nanhaiensis]
MNRYRHLFCNGKKFWILLSSLIAIVGLCAALHLLFVPEDNVSLSCSADLYSKKPNRDLSLGLEIETRGELVTLKYRFFKSGIEKNSMILSGKVSKLDLTSMSLKLELDSGQVISNLAQKGLSKHMNTIVDASRLAITNGTPLTLGIHLLELDEKNNYAIIQFTPDDGIWGCDLKIHKLPF